MRVKEREREREREKLKWAGHVWLEPVICIWQSGAAAVDSRLILCWFCVWEKKRECVRQMAPPGSHFPTDRISERRRTSSAEFWSCPRHRRQMTTGRKREREIDSEKEISALLQTEPNFDCKEREDSRLELMCARKNTALLSLFLFWVYHSDFFSRQRASYRTWIGFSAFLLKNRSFFFSGQKLRRIQKGTQKKKKENLSISTSTFDRQLSKLRLGGLHLNVSRICVCLFTSSVIWPVKVSGGGQ